MLNKQKNHLKNTECLALKCWHANMHVNYFILRPKTFLSSFLYIICSNHVYNSNLLFMFPSALIPFSCVVLYRKCDSWPISIHPVFTTAYPALHWLKPVPALIGRRWGTPLDKSPIYHGADRDKQAIALTFTTTDNLESLIHWTRLPLVGGGGWTARSEPMQALEKHANSTQESPGSNPEPFCCEATPQPAYWIQRFMIWLTTHSYFEYLCTKLLVHVN